ncbi:unnamed protein product [Lasius platythorax]|uniref:Uncharacterized protein n=1 Tax=Lasius platythorax TaxID=488582 RepID=A0AAV2N1J1_9HYME
MRTVHLVGLLFCVSLPLIAGFDLRKIIRTAQCQSSCLRNLTTDDECWNVGKNENRPCQMCWETCAFLGTYNNKMRLSLCKKRIFFNLGCEIACTFYRTHGIEEDKYEPTKLPAPEEDEIIRINKHDIAVKLRKNLLGIWEMEEHYSNQKTVMNTGNWIIITNENGSIKQYSWEKWKPTLETIKENGPLFQASITWTDWQAQLKKQREEVTFPEDKVFLELQNRKKLQIKPSFVVTWQEETGNGIMGNQVADSESAQISVPSGRYLVRIATNDGPGSYSIVIDTDKFKTQIQELKYSNTEENSNTEEFSFSTWPTWYIIFVCILNVVMILMYLNKLFVSRIRKNKNKNKNKNENNIEMACLPEAEIRPIWNTRIPCFECELNPTVNCEALFIASSDSDISYINDQLWTVEVDINANADMQDANVQDANANIQDVTANTQDATANVIQQT